MTLSFIFKSNHNCLTELSSAKSCKNWASSFCMWQQTWLTVSWNHISELVEFFLFHLPEISLLSTHITLPRSENHAWTCEHNAAFIKSVSRRSGWLHYIQVVTLQHLGFNENTTQSTWACLWTQIKPSAVRSVTDSLQWHTSDCSFLRRRCSRVASRWTGSGSGVIVPRSLDEVSECALNDPT